MSRIVTIAALVVLSGTLDLEGAAEEPRRTPNVILCMADDQGWGDVGYNGHPRLKTPVLDEMARSGLRFDRFYAAAPVCSPTRGSVLTGRHPNRFGCFKWGHPLRPQEITIAEVLRKAGYATGHFGKWHLGSMRAGEPTSPGESGFDEWIASPNFYENDPLMSDQGRVVELKGESSLVTVEAALPFVRGAAKEKKPFLAVIWFGNPHTPHEAVAELAELYDDQPPAVRNYLAEVTGIDRAMGRLREELDALGVRDDTLLWYTSDNGSRPPGLTGGLRGHKGQLWEGGIRVPGLIEWPSRVRSPRTIDVPCNTVDIYPTILGLVGIENDASRPLDGVSLMPLIDGRTAERSKPMGFWDYQIPGRPMRSREILQQLAKQPDRASGSDPTAPDPSHITQRYSPDDRPGYAAWMDGRYKLHRIPQKNDGFRYELYDLVADSKEQNDIAGEHPERVGRMKAALEDWQRSVIRSLNGEDYDSSR